jgi:hypothetical protein
MAFERVANGREPEKPPPVLNALSHRNRVARKPAVKLLTNEDGGPIDQIIGLGGVGIGRVGSRYVEQAKCGQCDVQPIRESYLVAAPAVKIIRYLPRA